MFGPGNCAAPEAATDLTLFHTGGVGGTTTLTWSPPLDSGAAPAAYDTLSSDLADGFGAGASSVCVESDGADTTSVDSTDPGTGEVLFYLVRAEGVCGLGPIGDDSFDNPRSAQPCPAS